MTTSAIGFSTQNAVANTPAGLTYQALAPASINALRAAWHDLEPRSIREQAVHTAVQADRHLVIVHQVINAESSIIMRL
jgi:hypothetical protein